VPPERLKLALGRALQLTRVPKSACRAIDGDQGQRGTRGRPACGISKKVGALEPATDCEALKKAVPALGGAVAEAGLSRDATDRARRDRTRTIRLPSFAMEHAFGVRIDDWVAERNLAASAPQNAQARREVAAPRRFADP
jgi:hypothetical protein